MDSKLKKLSNGVEIPSVGFGTYRLVNDDNNACDMVRKAIEMGYRNIDTASFYGNEKGVGEGIRTSGVPREEIFVSTKPWIDSDGYENTIKA